MKNMTYRDLLIKLSKMSAKELDMLVLGWDSDSMLHNIKGIIKSGNPDKCKCSSCICCDYLFIEDGNPVLNFNSRLDQHE